MSGLMRLFVGAPVGPTPQLKMSIRHLEEMGDTLGVTPADQLHVTLKFLGDCDPRTTADLCQITKEACAAEQATLVKLHGLGVFPHRDRPSILWAGLDDGGLLKRLAEQLEADFFDVGFPRERRPFRAHLTLARVRQRPPPEFFSLLDRMADKPLGEVTISSVVLYQSELLRSGARYTTLGTFRLPS